MQRVYIIMVSVLWLGAIEAGAQQAQTPADTAENRRVTIDRSRQFEYLRSDTGIIQRFIGEVELRQDSIYMYCDTAVVKDQNEVFATGNVIIQQGDSISVFSDSLYYYADSSEADLRNEVVLVSGGQQFFTQRLQYDLDTKIAVFNSGALLTDGETQLSSRRGYYDVGAKVAYFRDSVYISNPDFSLKADSLRYNTASEIVFFDGPTLITDDSSRIYCEAGYYDLANKEARFILNAQFKRADQIASADTIYYSGREGSYVLRGNARFREGGRLARADTIRYNEQTEITELTGNARFTEEGRDIGGEKIIYDFATETYRAEGRSRISDPPQILEADRLDFSEASGRGVATGNVMWRDTAADLVLRCARAEYERERDYIKASGGDLGRPLLITVLEDDSLYLSSDTLLSLRPDTSGRDTSRHFYAYRRVRIFKSDLQAICDSLVFAETDSMFHLFEEPVIWSDTTQFSADTVRIRLAGEQIDRIDMTNEAFIINSPDEVFFNQIKGRDITAFFQQGELRRMRVEGNAESSYYARDEEDAYIGVNSIICSEMLFLWGDNQVDAITFYDEPKATFYPMQRADHAGLMLEGFDWRTDCRPRRILDVFNICIDPLN